MRNEIAVRLTVVPTQALSDQAIADAIVEELERRVTVDPTELVVTVVDGFVTLTGSVPTRSARDAAVLTARHTAGVVGVRDNLLIS